MPNQNPQYQGRIINLNEDEEGPQKIGSRKNSLLSGFILFSIVFVMIATAFWSKSFGAGTASPSPTGTSATPSLATPNVSDFSFVYVPQDQPSPLALGDPLPGWKLVQALDSFSNTGAVWTALPDQPSQVAVHLICYGYDEVLVTIELTIRNAGGPYLTQSAIFDCQPEGKDARIIFNQGTDGYFSQLMIMPMSYPSSRSAAYIYAWNGLVVQWVAGIEEPLCGNYTGAFPGDGINTCPTSSASPVPANLSSAPTK